MDPIDISETEHGLYSLWLEAGTTDVDDAISQAGHTPNGYFWEGITELLIAHEAPHLGGRLNLDPEAGAFCAYSNDRAPWRIWHPGSTTSRPTRLG